MTHVSTVNKLNYVEDSVLNDNYYFAQYLTMGALVNGRVCLMRNYRDAVQCAVFRAVTMICALRNSAADRLIALRMIHGFDLLCWFAVIMPAKYGFIPNLACRIIKAPNLKISIF